MAREGKVIVKILKDVCSPIPYMGHSHERSLVHLLNPCDDVNRKDIQCNSFSFDYYEEGDNIVFKVKDNSTIVGYNVSKEFTVVYWSAEDNNFIHTQGDGNGGNFNRSGFFVQEGDYYVGKVNKEWFLRNFDSKEIAIRVAYFDLDNHEEELIFCYSQKKNPNDYTRKNKSIKCSPILEVTRQDSAAGYNYHLVLSINDVTTNFEVGEEVKYYFKYSIDDVEQPEELIYTHTTGGLVPNKEKDVFVLGHVKKVHFKFRVEYPNGYDLVYPETNQRKCYTEQTEMTPNSSSNPNPNKPTIKCSPLLTIKEKYEVFNGWNVSLLLQARATIPENLTTKFYLSYSINDDNHWTTEELVHTDTAGGTIADFYKNLYIKDSEAKKVYLKFRIQYPPEVNAEGYTNNSCESYQNVDLKEQNNNSGNKKTLSCASTIEVVENKVISGSNLEITLKPNGLESLPGEEVKYYLERKNDGISEVDSLLFTHTTGGVLSHINKSDYIPSNVFAVDYLFKLEFPSNYYFTETKSNICTSTYHLQLKQPVSCSSILDFKESTKEAIIEVTLTENKPGNYKIVPKLYGGFNTGSEYDLGHSYTDMGNNRFLFTNIDTSSNKSFKGVVEITDLDTGLVVSTCETSGYITNDSNGGDTSAHDQSTCTYLSISKRNGDNGKSKAVVDLVSSIFHRAMHDSFTLKFFYRLKSSLDFNYLKEYSINDYSSATEFSAQYESTEGYYMKAELYKDSTSNKMCETEELLIE